MKKKPSKITLEKLAQMTQREFTGLRSEMATGFAEVRSEMATKTDLQELRTEMATKTDLQELRTEMATKEDLHAFTKEITVIFREEVRKINYAPEIDDLRQRMKRVEERLGLKSSIAK
ncbi:MAG: hypothetical protein HY978_03885 [Candidatus Liptonbacteria bacterium]|nr:hypothetical protein [Candidatus Liptonbacteria bacterium]